MNRLTLGTMMGVAVIAANTAAATAQPGQAGADAQGTHWPADTMDSRASADAPGYDWGIDRFTTADHAQRPTEADTPLTSGATSFTTLDWLDDLDRRVTRQETVFRHALTWTPRFAGVLVLLFGGCIAYFWVRLAQLAARCGDRAECLDSPVAAPQMGVGGSPPSTRPAVVASLPAPTRVPHLAPVMDIPRVQFLSGVIDCLAAGINESRRRRGTVETGYALVGKILGEGPSRTVIVSGLIDEGPNSARSGGHHQADREYQQRELELLQLVDGEAMFIGDAHLHPGSLDTCSGGDYRTDLANVRASHSQEMVFVIATAESAYWGVRSPHGLCRHGLTLHFYYLGKSSGYEYRRFRPEVIQSTALSVPIDLRRFAAGDPIRTRLDFDNLRRLTAYRMTVGELPADGQHSRPCIVMTHKTKGFKAMIAFSADPRQRPEVFVENDTQMMQFQPTYLNGGWTAGLVWFTPIVLDIEREMTGRPNVGTDSNNSPRAGERSAPAGAKASGPIGADHGKHPIYPVN